MGRKEGMSLNILYILKKQEIIINNYMTTNLTTKINDKYPGKLNL